MPRLIVANKADLPAVWRGADIGAPLVAVSSKTGDGLEALRGEIRAALEGANPATARDYSGRDERAARRAARTGAGGAAARR